MKIHPNSNYCDLNFKSSIADYLAQQPGFSHEHLTQLMLNQHRAGWLEAHIAEELSKFSHLWKIENNTIALQGNHLALQLQLAAEHLRKLGLILGWRNENYGIYAEDECGNIDLDHALGLLERASFRRFGLVSRAVHINAYYPDGSICLGKRAKTKGIDPNKLDNMAAGGIPFDESIYDCAIRELEEEANVPANLAREIQFINSIHIKRNELDGTHNEIVYCFDLALPEHFVPHNRDGEVAEFFRLNQSDVLAHLAEMTWDAGRVTAEFLLRKAV